MDLHYPGYATLFIKSSCIPINKTRYVTYDTVRQRTAFCRSVKLISCICFQTSPGVRSDRFIELMATIRASVRRDWKEMRRAFRVRFLQMMLNLILSLIRFRSDKP